MSRGNNPFSKYMALVMSEETGDNLRLVIGE